MKDPVKGGTSIQSFDDVNDHLKQIAEHETFLTQQEAYMNEEMNDVRAKYEEKTKAAKMQKLALEQEIEGFCKVNKSKFDSVRSKILTFGKVFFRTATPKVSQLNKKYSVDTSIELVKKLLPAKFLRVKTELNKEEFLTALAAKEIDDQQLAAVGLRVDQSDNFGYEINWEAIKEK
jgi:phage host-nuclease inhibitor protein Gam